MIKTTEVRGSVPPAPLDVESLSLDSLAEFAIERRRVLVDMTGQLLKAADHLISLLPSRLQRYANNSSAFNSGISRKEIAGLFAAIGVKRSELGEKSSVHGGGIIPLHTSQVRICNLEEHWYRNADEACRDLRYMKRVWSNFFDIDVLRLSDSHGFPTARVSLKANKRGR